MSRSLCEKCQDIDRAIERYLNLAARVTDALTLKGLEQLIEKLAAEKAALHTDPIKDRRQTRAPPPR